MIARTSLSDLNSYSAHPRSSQSSMRRNDNAASASTAAVYLIEQAANDISSEHLAIRFSPG